MKAGTPKRRPLAFKDIARGGPYSGKLVPRGTFSFRVEVNGFRWHGRYDSDCFWHGTHISLENLP